MEREISEPSSTNSLMNDLCKSCGAELPTTPTGADRLPCPTCGASARIIQATVHAVAGAATCKAEGIVIRPDPAVLELRVPEVQVVVSEPRGAERPLRGRSKPSLQERRMAAYRVLREDLRASEPRPVLMDEMIWRIHVLLKAMERDVEDGRY